ncbi:hypothetical protein L2D75_32030, partial [Pseudomonas aeruginosa]|uniref:hypothetical protein n=1 Tax=Pseudomonas aeruginosa TaxID=287 RepID=UPI001F308DCD
IICFERFRVGAVAEIRVVKINLSPFLISKGAPVYMGATTSDVMSYFRQLAGVENMPVAKSIKGTDLFSLL